MIRFKQLCRTLLAASLVCLLGTIMSATPALAQEALRPEVGKPLQAAQDLYKAKKYKEALNKVNEADRAGSKNSYEQYTIDRMRGSIAASLGDIETATRSFEAVIASPRSSPAERLTMMQALGSLYYRANNYAKAAAWSSRYLKEGGTDGQMRTLLIQSYYLTGDCASVSRELQGEMQADEKAGRAPSEERLQMLANCYLKQKDNAGYASALEKLVTYYPKKDYWVDLINRIQRKPAYSDRLDLDVYRIKLATGNLTTANDYLEMAQLALAAGYSAEAKKVVDQGFASGVLGTGTDADRHKRLRDLAIKQLADDQKTLPQREVEATSDRGGTGLLNVGFAYVGNGQFDKGLALMEQGMRKGDLKRADDAKLHLGIAYQLAGQKAKAAQILKTVQGGDGTADLARLWLIQTRKAAA
jgi:tetratricopeptide (TPR) repeat protein